MNKWTALFHTVLMSVWTWTSQCSSPSAKHQKRIVYPSSRLLKTFGGYSKERWSCSLAVCNGPNSLLRHWILVFFPVCQLSVCVYWKFSCVLSVVAEEFQRFECEPSERNQKYFTLIANSHLFFHSNLRSCTHSGWRVSECFGVCVSVQPVQCCVHDRPFFPHSVGREVWAAMELRTLIPFTTVGVNGGVRAKCWWELLLWKGPLSRVSFQVSAERDTMESHGQLVCLSLHVWASVPCLYNVLLGRFVLLKPDQVCVTATAWVCIYRAVYMCARSQY